MPRFYLPQALAIGSALTLPDQIAHHIQVLRLQAGDAVTLFNGEGGEYTATLTAIEKKRAHAEVKTFSPREAELPYALTLARPCRKARKWTGSSKKPWNWAPPPCNHWRHNVAW